MKPSITEFACATIAVLQDYLKTNTLSMRESVDLEVQVGSFSDKVNIILSTEEQYTFYSDEFDLYMSITPRTEFSTEMSLDEGISILRTADKLYLFDRYTSEYELKYPCTSDDMFNMQMLKPINVSLEDINLWFGLPVPHDETYILYTW